MASSRNIRILTGATDTNISVALDYPYDMFIIGDQTIGTPNAVFHLPYTDDIQDGYTFYLMDPNGYIANNGPYLVASENDNTTGNTIYVNGILLSQPNTGLINAIQNNQGFVSVPTLGIYPLYQPFSAPNTMYKIVYEGFVLGQGYFTLYNMNNSSHNTNQYIDGTFFTGGTQTPISITGNTNTVDGAPDWEEDDNMYTVYQVGGSANFFTPLNTVLVDCNLINDPNPPDHYILQLPDLTNGNYAGTAFKFVMRNATLGAIQDNGGYIMVASISDSTNGRPTPRIIAPSIKTYYNGNYYVPLLTGESLELTWSGVEWFVTNISKQEYVQFNAKSFIHLNRREPQFFDSSYIEQNADNLTFDLDDVASSPNIINRPSRNRI